MQTNDTGLTEVRRDFENTGLLLRQTGFYFGFVREVRTQLVDELRAFFRDNPVTSEYRWVGRDAGSGQFETDLDNSKIGIAVDHADNPKFSRSVMVSGCSARIRDLWFNTPTHQIRLPNPGYSAAEAAAAAEEGTDYDVPQTIVIGERLTGRLDFTIKLTCRALAEPELDEISDLMLHGLIGQVRIHLARIGMNWLPDTGQLSDTVTETLTNRQTVFAKTLTFGLRTEWARDFVYDVVNIANIELADIEFEPAQDVNP